MHLSVPVPQWKPKPYNWRSVSHKTCVRTLLLCWPLKPHVKHSNLMWRHCRGSPRRALLWHLSLSSCSWAVRIVKDRGKKEKSEMDLKFCLRKLAECVTRPRVQFPMFTSWSSWCGGLARIQSNDYQNETTWNGFCHQVTGTRRLV